MKKLSFYLLCVLLVSCSSADSKFIGQWQFYTGKDNENNSYENIMKGLVCPLKKLEGTQESYSFTYFNDKEIIFTKKDDNTLISNDIGVITLRIDESTKRLILNIGSNTESFSAEVEFTKLK
jgi:hypothetical protein